MNLLDQYGDIIRSKDNEVVICCILLHELTCISSLGDMEPLREQLTMLLVRLRERGRVHPKMEELRNIMCRWVTKCEGNRKKAIVVLEREFPSLSGEILDTFQSIRGKLCMYPNITNYYSYY